MRHWLDRWWGADAPRSEGGTRADRVRAIRDLLPRRSERGPATERELAAEMRGLRQRIAALTGQPQACRGCVRPCPRRPVLRRRGRPAPPPAAPAAVSPWRGGACCGTRTENVFTPDEIAALGEAGTRPTDLRPPRGPENGCVFRGVTGCSLRVVDRPTICVTYVCPELARELHTAGVLGELERLSARLEARFDDYRGRRQERLEQERVDRLGEALVASRKR